MIVVTTAAEENSDGAKPFGVLDKAVFITRCFAKRVLDGNFKMVIKPDSKFLIFFSDNAKIEERGE